MEPRASLSEQEAQTFEDFCRKYRIPFNRIELLKLALTHRSYLSVTGQSARESNERLEFLGDSVLGLVTSEFLYRQHPNEHEGQLTKTKSLLVSKAILSRRALAMGLGRYVLMSQSESESGGRQRLSILADAFESVVAAIYLDQGFEAARQFIAQWLLNDTREIVADKRHTNYKSHLQEYVQSTFRTHPVYRIRSEMGPDHSKQFNVEVLVGRRMLGSGRGRNKKEAEQAAARNALESVETRNRPEPAAAPPAAARPHREELPAASAPAHTAAPVAPSHESHEGDDESGRRRRGRRGGRGRRRREEPGAAEPAVRAQSHVEPRAAELPTEGLAQYEEETDDVGRPDDMLEERRVDPFGWGREAAGDPGEPQRTDSASRDIGGRSVERLRGYTVPSEPLHELPEDDTDEPHAEPSRSDAHEHEPEPPSSPAREPRVEPSQPVSQPSPPQPAGPSFGRRPGRGRR